MLESVWAWMARVWGLPDSAWAVKVLGWGWSEQAWVPWEQVSGSCRLVEAAAHQRAPVPAAPAGCEPQGPAWG